MLLRNSIPFFMACETDQLSKIKTYNANLDQLA
jgi:hypothetical protein